MRLSNKNSKNVKIVSLFLSLLLVLYSVPLQIFAGPGASGNGSGESTVVRPDGYLNAPNINTEYVGYLLTFGR